MALRRSLLSFGLLILVAGCNAPAGKRVTSATPELPAYRPPAEIRPSDASIQPPASSIGAPVSAAGAGKPHLAGNWTPPVKPRAWKYVVLHHSASAGGNAAAFDREHRADNGWDELGYHFVINNGRGGPDGRIEVGPRWLKQKWGAHAKTPDNRFNDFGIGICFVGNFEQSKPTAKQLESAERLVAWLMATYHIPARNVIGHEDTGRKTLCPGKNFSVAQVRTLAMQSLARAGIVSEEVAHAALESPSADRELLIAR